MNKARLSVVPTTQSNATPIGKFVVRPAPNDWQPFLHYVLHTGRPHLWEQHTHTKPPKDGDFVELVAFEIPAQFHSEDYLAPCPICSPNAGKYFHGVLAWFPREGVLRAIGFECAASHFGNAKANQARNERLMRERREATEYYLIDTLPKLLPLKPQVLAIQKWAHDVDIAIRAITKKVTKGACRKLCNTWPDGELFAWQEIKTSRVNQFGKMEEHSERVKAHGGVKIAGFSFFKSAASGSTKMQSLAEQTLVALEKVPSKTRDEALDLVANELTSDQALMSANRLVQNALVACDQLTKLSDDAQAFFSVENLMRLSSWTQVHSNGSPVQFGYDAEKPYRLMVKSQGRSWEQVEVPRFGIYRGPQAKRASGSSH